VRGCPISRIDACEFEQFTEDPNPPTQLRSNRRGLTIENSPCCTVSSSAFFNAVEHSDPGQRGIFATYPGGGPPGSLACVIFPCRFANVKVAIEIDGTAVSAARDCAVFPQFIAEGTGEVRVPWGKQNSGMVTLGKPYATTEPGVSKLRSAMFLPVVTTAQRPTPQTPQERGEQVGLTIFDSDVQALLMWNGADWQAV
jgi:hypothetical protein